MFDSIFEKKESKKPVDIELSSKDGMWTWNLKYNDGSVGPEERTGISITNQQGIKLLVSELKEKNRIPE